MIDDGEQLLGLATPTHKDNTHKKQSTEQEAEAEAEEKKQKQQKQRSGSSRRDAEQ